MTAQQLKRIRTRLERAAKLTQEANKLYEAFNPHQSLGDQRLHNITANAADAGTRILRDLEYYDQDTRMEAERVARESAPLEVGDTVADQAQAGTSQVRGTIQGFYMHGVKMAVIREPSGITADRPVSRLFRIHEMDLER